jgi:hypothetical protein
LIDRPLSTGDTSTADHRVSAVINLLVEIAFGALILFPAHQAVNPDMEAMLSRLVRDCRFGCDQPSLQCLSSNQDAAANPNTRKRWNVGYAAMDHIKNVGLRTSHHLRSFRDCEHVHTASARAFRFRSISIS